jgi:hypothetical protein
MCIVIVCDNSTALIISYDTQLVTGLPVIVYYTLIKSIKFIKRCSFQVFHSLDNIHNVGYITCAF